MVVVTHEMGFARHVSSHVIFLHQGKIEEEGHPDALFGAPKSPRLQQFLKGSLNIGSSGVCGRRMSFPLQPIDPVIVIDAVQMIGFLQHLGAHKALLLQQAR